jgi:hypothetical protein
MEEDLPEGGYVYLYKEHEPGWYVRWFQPPTYTKVEGGSGGYETQFRRKRIYRNPA